MLLRRVANDARLDMYSAGDTGETDASPRLLATKVIINPNYDLEPVQSTSPKQASREPRFYSFSVTREALTTDIYEGNIRHSAISASPRLRFFFDCKKCPVHLVSVHLVTNFNS